MIIKHLTHTQIDKNKWDLCISKAFNGIVYASSWYLDIVSENWEALVEGDYVRVMPLPVKKKYKIDYIIQPLFTQQLGVFSIDKLDSSKVMEFIEAIPEKYKYVTINLNTNNKIEGQNINSTSKSNFELDLIKPYDLIKNTYAKNTKRNINKAENNKISLSESVTINELIHLYKENVGKPIEHFNDMQYNILRKILSYSLLKGKGRIIGAYTEHNTLCAAVFLLQSQHKIINLISVSNKEGKALSAMFLVFDRLIKSNSEKNLILDFEGSNKDSIARFYKGFGSSLCTYSTIKINKLPFYIKFFKS